jgi:hypothetical protein
MKQDSHKEQNIKELLSYEGLWKDLYSHSTICLKVYNGNLFAPYCYGGDSCLMAHYFDIILIENTLYGKFKWFSGTISGYAFWRKTDDNIFQGGWWYEDRVPEDIKNNIQRLNDYSDGMVKVRMRRIGNINEFPVWAKKYFDDLENDDIRFE